MGMHIKFQWITTWAHSKRNKWDILSPILIIMDIRLLSFQGIIFINKDLIRIQDLDRHHFKWLRMLNQWKLQKKEKVRCFLLFQNQREIQQIPKNNLRNIRNIHKNSLFLEDDKILTKCHLHHHRLLRWFRHSWDSPCKCKWEHKISMNHLLRSHSIIHPLLNRCLMFSHKVY